MSNPDETKSTAEDQSPTNTSENEDEAMVVFEFAVPAEAFVFETALREFPDVIVEQERLVPTNNNPMPYLWTTGGQSSEFKNAMADDRAVNRINKVSLFDEGSLYHIEWAETDGELLQWISNTDEDIALLQAKGNDDEWILKFRFPSRSRLAEFRTFYEQQEIDLRIIRLYDLTDPKMGEYNITDKQREALIEALEMGHFEVPREATLDEVAYALDISSKSVSERLRRGQTNLISNTLTIGQPTGVGLGTH